jgi:hypothetical protein
MEETMDQKFDLINDAFSEIDQITDKLFEDLSKIYDEEDGSEIVVPVKLDAVLSANIKVSKFDIKALYLDLEKAKFENEVKRIFLKGNYRYKGNGDDRQAFDELDGEMKEAMSYHQTTKGGN